MGSRRGRSPPGRAAARGSEADAAMLAFHEPRVLAPLVSGPYVTLALVAAVALSARMFPEFPDMSLVMMMAVVYAAFAGGLPSGMVSAGMVVAWGAASFAEPGQPLHFVGPNLQAFLILAMVAPASVVFVGRLRDRAERAWELQREQERLRELDQLKVQFLNNAAHELRTPLTPIKLQMHLLKRLGQGTLTEQQQRAIQLVDKNIERLNLLVDDLLEVARIQAGRLNLHKRPTDLQRLVAEAAESFQEPVTQAGVRLEVRAEPNLWVEADPKRLIQVLFNLINNALKFTPRGGEVAVEAARAPDGQGAVVRVRDTGMGMKPEDVARLFQPFTQVHDPNQVEKHGSGLGLFICKGILEQHGGRIWAESEGLGRGATFAFAMPLAPPRPAGTGAPEEGPLNEDAEPGGSRPSAWPPGAAQPGAGANR